MGKFVTGDAGSMFDSSLTLHAGMDRKPYSLASALDLSDTGRHTSSGQRSDEDELSSNTLTGNSRAGDWTEKRSLFNIKFDIPQV